MTGLVVDVINEFCMSLLITDLLTSLISAFLDGPEFMPLVSSINNSF